MSIERWNVSSHCPVCGGHPGLPRGQGVRCTGYRSGDFVHCTRPEYAGDLDPTDAAEPTYPHLDATSCKCGQKHQSYGPGRFLLPAKARRTRVLVSERFWPVKNAAGILVAKHWRKDYDDGGKEYPFQRPDGAWGLGDTLKPADLLYGLEMLSEAPSKPVVVVEGEKSADALRGLVGPRCVVLATVCGAQSTPTREVLEQLRGRKVYLWPDNDDVGREHMHRIANLLEGVVTYARVIAYGSSAKDDAADFVERGGTLEHFRELIETARDPGNSDESWDSVVSQPVKFLWHPYIPRGKVTLLEGQPGIGKSWVALSITAAVTKGFGLPGMASGAGTVLFLSAEDDVSDTLKPRIATMDVDLKRIFSENKRLTFNAEGWARFDALMERRKPSLVVLDPLFAFVGSRVDINKANEMRAVMTDLYERAMRYDCAILGIRHLTKAGGNEGISRGVGTIDIAAAARSILLAGASRDNPGECGVVHVKSSLAAKGPSLGYRLDGDKFAWTGHSNMTEAHILDRSPLRRADDSGIELCAQWMRVELTGGRAVQDALFKKAKQAGYDRPSFLGAMKTLNVRQLGQGVIGLPAKEDDF